MKHSIDVSSLIDLLLWRALHEPDQPAYIFLSDKQDEEWSITYRELDRQAQAIAALLQRSSTVGERAILLFPPGLDYIAAFFGCLYAGIIAVPAYPPRLNRASPRLESMVADAQPTLALTTTLSLAHVQRWLVQMPSLAALRWLATDDLEHGGETSWHKPKTGAETLAFLQYTSGSTSLPKGVMLTHANLLHNLALTHRHFQLTPESRPVFWLPPYHDMGLIGGILQPIYGGFPVTLMSPVAFLQQPFRWLQTISQRRATASGAPNFAYELCVQKTTPEQRASLDLRCWQTTLNGAEPVRPATIERFCAAFQACGFRREVFYPCYGLAEATLFVSCSLPGNTPVTRSFDKKALAEHRVVLSSPEEEHAQVFVSCGQPECGQRVVIVDPETLLRCLPSQVGEIWVTSPSVAQGYWNHPDETKRTFQAHLADTQEGPFLRTGDLGMLLEGELFVMGRCKDMLIIRGRNHYPQDIEQTVEQAHALLRPGCCAAFSLDEHDEERLVVVQEVTRHYVSSQKEEVALAVRQAVSSEHELQIYALVLIKSGTLPKTSSGKIQHQACKASFLAGTFEVIDISMLQDVAEVVGDEETASLSLDTLLQAQPAQRQALLETTLKRLLAQKVGMSSHSIDVAGSLSALGLDSLQAIEIAYEIDTCFGITLPLTSLLQDMTLAQLSAEILARYEASSAPSSDTSVMAQTSITDQRSVLSYGQRALWFLHQLAPQSTAYTIARAVRVTGSLDVAALQRAFQTLLARHAALRMTFTSTDGEPMQVAHAHPLLPWQVYLAEEWDEAFLQARLQEEKQRPFELTQGALLRLSVFVRAPEKYVLLLAVHHIVMDFWSFSVLVREFRTLYAAERAAEVPVLAPPCRHYMDYVSWQMQMLEGDEGARHWLYWQKHLAGDLPVLSLPVDKPRQLVQTYHGAVWRFRLASDLTNHVKQLAKAFHTTLYTTLLAVLLTLLHRSTGQEDVIIGTLATGRTQAQWADLVGYFVNPLIIRAAITDQQTFAAVLEQVRALVLAALEHQDYPFALLLERLQLHRDAGHASFFQSMFVWQSAQAFQDASLAAFALEVPHAHLNVDHLQLEPWSIEDDTAQFDLTLTMAEVDGCLEGLWRYNLDLFYEPTIERLSQHFQTMLASLVHQPRQRIADVCLLTEGEKRLLVHTWNNTEQVIQPSGACLHQLFELQVARTPADVALVCGERHYTYAQLNSEANQLAQRLQALHVGPETLVGIYMDRSPAMVIAVLAILKAGGAYVPFDPAYPHERLAFMLTDSRMSMLLTQEHLAATLPAHHVQVLCFACALEKDESNALNNPLNKVCAENLAYVIYTSGSTGQPKGVAITHRSAVAFITWSLSHFRRAELAGVLASTSLCFDLSIFELFAPLCSGGTVILVENALHLMSLASTIPVTLVNTVPSAMRELVQADGLPSSVRTVNLAGEPLYAALVNQLYQRTTVQRVFNLYGPTEDTTYSTYSLVERESEQEPTIGRPIAGTSIYLLDAYCQLVPIGSTGELYLGGLGLARGYLNQPALTATRFLPDPFSSVPGARLYKTGDLARYRHDGQIEYLGRRDHLVKVRGFRIELGEIEAVLGQHPAVQEAVVLVHERFPGDQRLVAYLTSLEAGTLSSEMLRHFLQEKLPAYMLPTLFILLEALPYAPNGKVDRQALLKLEGVDIRPATAYIAPQTAMEQTITTIWQEVLDVPRVGMHDNFFDLGGHSLLLLKVQQRIEAAYTRDIPIVKMFQYPTVSGLVAYLNWQQNENVALQQGYERIAARRDASNIREQTRQRRRMAKSEH